MIVHVHSAERLWSFGCGPEAQALMERFWPGADAFASKEARLPAVTNAGLQSVALRMPDHTVALKFKRLRPSVAAPSANLSGSPPTSAAGAATCAGYANSDGGAARWGGESVLDLAGKSPPSCARGVFEGNAFSSAARRARGRTARCARCARRRPP
jgi:L-threonylcarbamoyladenylate synthase